MKNILLIVLISIAFNVYSQIPEGYYYTADGLSGEALKEALHNIIDNHTEYSYDDIRYILDETDRDPDNSNNLILLYKGTSVSNVWDAGVTYNREHVWAKSHGDFDTDPPAGTDLHHIRPADPSVNSSRSDKDFDNGGVQHSEATECYSTSTTWEPRDAVKGDVARMMFYMAVRYEGDVSGEPDLELVDHITSYPDPEFGVLSTLIEWNAQDPVDDFERNRNEVIYSYQGNRNPFIDHPEYVNAIFNAQNNAPEIDDQEFTIAENSENGTEVGTVVASDADDDDLTFSILSGNTDDAFAIEETTGLLTVNNSVALDYEVTPSFNLNISVNDGSASSSATITVNVDNTNSISTVALASQIRVYPNPTSGVIHINLPDSYSAEIYSIIGSKLLSLTDKEINISYLDAGIYFVLIKDEYGETIKSIKLLKK